MIGKHTPGPWQTKPEECGVPYIRVRGTVLGGRHKIANVITPVYEGVHQRELEETRANARLIAAAPDLLFQLLAASNYIDALGGDGNSYRAAIAKATGQEGGAA